MMKQVLRVATWAAFALLLYLFVADTLHRWIALPAPGSIGFVLVFTTFSLLHCGLSLGGRRLMLFVAAAFAISYAMEELGVRTGLVFGPYHYSDMLGTKLDKVPLLIPLGWFMMIYPSWVVARALLSDRDLDGPVGQVALALTGAFVMTGWDMVMDPPMVLNGNWVWEQGGPYFGVPIHNYVGWLVTLVLVYLAFGLIGRAIRREAAGTYRFADRFSALPVVAYTAFACEYLPPRHYPELSLVVVFTMLVPGGLALLRLVLPKSPGAQP